MADIKESYQDAAIDINYGLSGFHTLTITVREQSQSFTKDQLTQLMPILYPSLDAWAKARELA